MSEEKKEEVCAEEKKEEPPAPVEEKPDPCLDPDAGNGDPQEKYRELCRRTAECKKYFKELTECNERVNSRTKTDEKCVEEVIDYFHCVDHCAAKKFFKLLK